jgi:hypothetical protein
MNWCGGAVQAAMAESALSNAFVEGDMVDSSADPDAQPVHAYMPGYASPNSRQEAAQRRLMRRHVELCETEDECVRYMSRLACCLHSFITTGPWNRGDKCVFTCTHDALQSASRVHIGVRGKLAASLTDAHRLGSVFEGEVRDDLIKWHSVFEEAASACSSILRSSECGEEQIEALDLLMRPTQRLMQYRLFLEEMLSDCRILDSAPLTLPAALEESLAAVKAVCVAVNENRRERERVERVMLLAERVQGVPEGVSLNRRGRILLLEQEAVMQKNCAAYRTLVLFNDALLVLQGSEQRSFSFFTASAPADAAPHAQPELHFRDLISLAGLDPVSSVVAEPPAASRDGADLGTAAARERSWSFELRGRVFYAAEAVVRELVHAVQEAVLALAESSRVQEDDARACADFGAG